MQNAANEVTNGLISKTLGKISNKNAISTKMSGSGCACFSLFENEQFAQECYNSNKDDEELQLFCVEVLML
jgi:4-diphosphocytidyl-2C-methyl-D-erythritol kinase